MLYEELKDFIGLSARLSTSASGLYVDALPDISVAGIDRMVECEEDVNSLWNDIQLRAIAKFRTLFFAEVNRCHHVSDNSKIDCLIVSNKDILATALWYLMGAEVMYSRGASSRMNSYTTLDRSKSKDIRQDLEDLFEKALHMAVAGIDIHHSACFADDCQPAIADIATFHTPIL